MFHSSRGDKRVCLMSRLEDLPDELLLDLFENHIRLIDSYLAFSRLNHRRLTAILRSCSFHVDIPSKDIFHRSTFVYFAGQIVSLRVLPFCPELDLSSLVHLRCLHLEKPTREQLLSLDGQSLPMLEYLSLSPCWFSCSELPKTFKPPFGRLRCLRLPDGSAVRFPTSSNK